jgi:hypothetical protein
LVSLAGAIVAEQSRLVDDVKPTFVEFAFAKVFICEGGKQNMPAFSGGHYVYGLL